MQTIRPVGRAACARVTALIRVSKGYRGAMHVRGTGSPCKASCSAYWLLHARIGLAGGGPARGGRSFLPLPRRECKMPRTELESSVHRLANRIECDLVDIFRELLAESRIEAVHSVGWNGCRFIETLREIRDGKEGGEV